MITSASRHPLESRYGTTILHAAEFDNGIVDAAVGTFATQVPTRNRRAFDIGEAELDVDRADYPTRDWIAATGPWQSSYPDDTVWGVYSPSLISGPCKFLRSVFRDLDETFEEPMPPDHGAIMRCRAAAQQLAPYVEPSLGIEPAAASDDAGGIELVLHSFLRNRRAVLHFRANGTIRVTRIDERNIVATTQPDRLTQVFLRGVVHWLDQTC